MIQIPQKTMPDETCLDTLWITDEQAAKLWGGIPLRTARHRLRNCQKMKRRSGGRPRTLYYVGSHAELSAKISASPDEAKPAELKQRVLQPDDLAVARLRMQAVREYIHLREIYDESRAVVMTVSEWSNHPRTDTVRLTERLGRNDRKHSLEVSVGCFSKFTLRRWARDYLDAGSERTDQLAALAPQKKTNVGRTKKEIPQDLINLIYALAVATPRADFEKAIALARREYPHAWPNVHDYTIIRRVRAKDPSRFCETLGKRGIADFRAKHSPDIDRDYSTLPFNGLIQLDDFRMDFYGHASDPRELVRPYVYGMERASTRQWLCAVACETPITQDQVRALIGFGLASKSVGIPDQIHFERGAVACDEYLQNQLESLGIKVSRTSMDGGRVHEGACKDNPRGHFQGKLIEANIRPLHGAFWDVHSQVGPEEKSTAQSRLETLKKTAEKLAKDSEFLILPTPAEWQALIAQKIEQRNNTPHSALPEIIDPSNGERRHMTPNERAKSMRDTSIRVMDERLLPLFFQKGVLVDVTRNGFRLNNVSYGRFEENLQALAGTKVTAYAMKDLPDVAYVVELGRCVERFEAVNWNDEDHGLIEKKRGIEKRFRNQYEKLIADAKSSASAGIAEVIRFTQNPTPERRFELVCPEGLHARANGITVGQRDHVKAQSKKAERFAPLGDSPAKSRRKSGKSLIRDTEEMRDHVAVVTGTIEGEKTEDRFEV